MKIRLERGLEGAARAEGAVVIIDVFRAFTTACHAVAAGAGPVLPVAEPEDIERMRSRHPDALAAGERLARPLPGCDFGNSPTEIDAAAAQLAGRTFIHATHAGTRGLLAAVRAQVVLAASLANAAATAAYLKTLAPPVVTLVPMGWAGDGRAAEDDAAAVAIRCHLLGRPFPATRLDRRLRRATAAAKFFDPDQPWAPEGDFHRCLHVDHFPFALLLVQDDPPRLSPRHPVAE